ncbi:MAG: selenite/tellurite reduction operon b-type cytochrome membrane protein ExtQ [Desulfobacteraceae bacterium]|nr:selenite/tellurite reduction operon b-type cytochrome membrane protein ExtQ [Desulfobacteraceae bacterium]MDH3574838.1 selenite/tellurite reduction operon b-type cytochrome membrane protein ExtQ [Desulfobacteraceae bacterium]MDH3838469.1 selenite/tellurite reduction operon b-type cytochrome membrane protein ExtQ [Desulfobacteraceae bacterium]MDH3882411.1 selenite/tellurite reduction operon b-type cytochrome membrane protein ExtQ [Desulfobacteraceae bacterium]PLX53427.1 MAG: cytochrome B6 [De
MKDYIPTSPFLFRMIKRALVLLIGVLLLLAFIVPAPLQNPGNLEKSPNPAKAAWFFLWIQELVSYSTHLIYVIMLAGLGFFLLPYLPGISEAKQAKWLPKDQQWINIVTLIIFLVISALTIIAMFFRGGNWAFVSLF